MKETSPRFRSVQVFIHKILGEMFEPNSYSFVTYAVMIAKPTKSRLNPLSPNSDQQQFSPNNVHTLSRDKVVRI